MNRIGDIGYLLGCVLIFVVYNTLDLSLLHLLSANDFNNAFWYYA
jgi:hypothetical protein